MRKGRSTHLAAIAVLVCSFASVGFAAPPELDEGAPPASRNCGTVETGPFMQAPDVAQIQKWIRDNRIAAGGVIPVNFHVIYGNRNEGNIPESQLDAQVTVLNRNFAGLDYNGNASPGVATGYTFTKASVTRTKNTQWFKMTPGSSSEINAKNALAVNWTSSLNLYVCKPGQSLLGWAVFPWTSQANTKQDGVVVHYGSLPGGYLSPYNLGGTASHEVGHWVGLYHTFQGGCTGGDTAPGCTTGGDLVCDTPAEATATSGCPSSKNTCASGGSDPIHNYMDYSYDSCYNQFTAGQDARMDWAMGTYRPSIGAAKLTPSAEPLAARSTVVDFIVAPNPFNPSTAIDFALPQPGHVSLRVYDVAGRLVTTLVDGDRAAGTHRVVFNGDGLASGIYMAVLETREQQLRKRLVLLK